MNNYGQKTTEIENQPTCTCTSKDSNLNFILTCNTYMAKKNKCILHVACLLGKQLLLSVAQGQTLLALLVNDLFVNDLTGLLPIGQVTTALKVALY